jgi:polyribonucleotide nucleotidyltransferase
MLDAVKFGHEQFGPVIKMINDFAAECNVSAIPEIQFR